MADLPRWAVAFGLAACIAASACHRGGAASSTIKLDADHNIMVVDAPPAYAVPAGASIVLDGAGYRADEPNSDGATTPTVVHVAHGKSEYYRAQWTRSGVVTLSAETLERLRGEQFSRFSAGQPYVLAVGTESPALDKISFSPMWVASIQVQDP